MATKKSRLQRASSLTKARAKSIQVYVGARLGGSIDHEIDDKKITLSMPCTPCLSKRKQKVLKRTATQRTFVVIHGFSTHRKKYMISSNWIMKPPKFWAKKIFELPAPVDRYIYVFLQLHGCWSYQEMTPQICCPTLRHQNLHWLFSQGKGTTPQGISALPWISWTKSPPAVQWNATSGAPHQTVGRSREWCFFGLSEVQKTFF